MKKYIALDIGNVICDVDFTNFSREIVKISGYHTLKEAETFLYRSQQAHDLGLTTMEIELAEKFTKNCDDLFHLLQEWNKTVKSNPTMNNFLKELLDNNVEIALLSNMGKEHSDIINNIITEDVFKNCVKFLSCQVGARKPTKLYYKTFLDMHPEFKHCLYIDDRKENLDMGTQFYFKSKHFALDSFRSTDEIKDALNNIRLDI